jgi:hypothetical protein
MVRPAVTQCINYVNMLDSLTLNCLRPANGPTLYPGFCHQKPALGTMKFKSYKEGTESVLGLVPPYTRVPPYIFAPYNRVWLYYYSKEKQQHTRLMTCPLTDAAAENWRGPCDKLILVNGVHHLVRRTAHHHRGLRVWEKPRKHEWINPQIKAQSKSFQNSISLYPYADKEGRYEVYPAICTPHTTWKNFITWQ